MSSNIVFEHVSNEKAGELYYSWANSEHWNPSTKGQDVKEVYHKIDSQGFIVGKITNEDGKEETVAIISAVRYGTDQAWIGFYISNPNHRGRGYGLATFNKALEYIGHDRPSVGLDGVMAQVPNYQKSGFNGVGWLNERRHGDIVALVEGPEQALAGRIARHEIPGLVPLSDDQVDFDQLAGIEKRYTGLDRPGFSKDWGLFHTGDAALKEHRFGAVVLSTDGSKDGKSGKPVIQGYACVRPAESSYRVGPLYADTPEIAKQLLVKLAYDVIQAEKQSPFGVPLKFDVDIPTTNEETVKLFNGLGWNDTFPCLRMWKGKVPEHDIRGAYGIATLEVG
ncbi:hypothetical protein BGZ76_009940 [Entomortierella beljakovae]|nr:hypothetical protein BGZ76_009940 [Entomortierella beljakovae]